MEFVWKLINHVSSQFGDMELFTSIVIGALIVVWVIGSIANRAIAHSAFGRFNPTLETQFAVAGSLAKESNSHYFVYSTGRARCSGQMVSLKLTPRNDLLSRFVFSWFWKAIYPTDRIIVEVFEAEIDSAVTAFLCRKYQHANLVKTIGEVDKCCKPHNGSLDGGVWGNHSSSSLTGFTYTCDAGGKAIGQSVFGKTSAIAVPEFVLKNVESVYVSGSSKCVKIELVAIPTSELEWKSLIDFTLSGLVDSLASVRVSEAVRAEVTAQRSAEADQAKRREEESKRREEQQKQKGTLSAEEREKLEEKRRKKEQRKNLKTGRIML